MVERARSIHRDRLTPLYMNTEALKEKIVAKDAEMDAMQKENETLKLELGGLEEADTELTNQISTLEDEITALTSLHQQGLYKVRHFRNILANVPGVDNEQPQPPAVVSKLRPDESLKKAASDLHSGMCSLLSWQQTKAISEDDIDVALKAIQGRGRGTLIHGGAAAGTGGGTPIQGGGRSSKKREQSSDDKDEEEEEDEDNDDVQVICTLCCEEVTEEELVRCSSRDCQAPYHRDEACMGPAEGYDGKRWYCEDCRSPNNWARKKDDRRKNV